MKTIWKWTKRVCIGFLKVFGIFLLITALVATYIVQTSGDENYKYTPSSELIVNDVTQLNPIRVGKIIKPKTSEQIKEAIISSTGPISIGGGRFSMGGQTAYEDSLHIDMRDFNKILDFNANQKSITVQTGVTWRDIQEYIDPYNLSIRIMQTYSNFTVGGSLSVNVHGRYIGEGPLIKSVESIKIVLANGEEKYANRNVNPDIFYAAIGGYGGIGVITEATLRLADNTKIERRTTLMYAGDYKEHFFKNIRNNSEIIFHNGDLYPPDYDEVLDVSWYVTDKPLIHEERIIPRNVNYRWGPKAADFVADYEIGKNIRKNIIDPVYYAFDRVVWRNWEASYDVAELEPASREKNTYVLREYFIPVEKFDVFVPKMKEIFNRNNANILNVSIRHAHAAPENYLSWAKTEVFAFVVYYRQGTDKESIASVRKWSIEMMDAAIELGGSYYLPYQIYDSQEQFLKAYPDSPKYFMVKNKVDPEYRFRNALWRHHYPSVESSLLTYKDSIKNYYRDEEQTYLTVPEWYLVFNPLEYAEYLQREGNPSDFPFMASLDEYWALYDRVVTVSKAYPGENSEYMTMLRVIGISTTIEFAYKSFYENTLGRFTFWLADKKYTEEDKIIAKAHRAYSDLIYDQAWYKFDFFSWIHSIWCDTSFFGENFTRKLERKLFFTLEFGFKTLYAKLIGFGAQTAYEQSEGLIYASVVIPQHLKGKIPEPVSVIHENSSLSIIAIPRWGAFTKIVPDLIANGVQFEDISGNKNIVISFVTTNSIHDNKLPNKNSKLLFKSRFVSNPSLERSVEVVKVDHLDELLNEANNRGYKLEHIYDF